MREVNNIKIRSGVERGGPAMSASELSPGKSYRRVGSNLGSTYFNIITTDGLSDARGMHIVDLNDMRHCKPDHESLQGLRFVESPITIATA
ncbi:hypothetical protein CPT_Ptah_016 [Stenotrophomonas phage Ptah]|uniref:Uncharacterized protein n=1 Tax=Stenotrophomonas phage Ptah TaxID=2859657 RepID=A0AAE7WLK9_9CAUD|nr:hypothetical protein CPT_Ptah_016 [Stenotrophomonas phage Ptah]